MAILGTLLKKGIRIREMLEQEYTSPFDLQKKELKELLITASQTEFGFNLGAGVTYPIGRATYFRGDFRYFKHIDDVPSIWRFTGGIAVRIGS